MTQLNLWKNGKLNTSMTSRKRIKLTNYANTPISIEIQAKAKSYWIKERLVTI